MFRNPYAIRLKLYSNEKKNLAMAIICYLQIAVILKFFDNVFFFILKRVRIPLIERTIV